MKIIISKKVRAHMEAHRNDFIVQYEKLIEWCKKNGQFAHLSKSFEEMVVEFPFPVGFGKLFETTPGDAVVYAQRLNRYTYTRFVKGKKPYAIKKCVICLKKNRNREDEYYLVTIFPGSNPIKEPEDRNIKTKEGLRESLVFWRKHALYYEPNIIKKESEKNSCPYSHLYKQLGLPLPGDAILASSISR